MMEWIKCTDNMPEDEIDVLITINNGYKDIVLRAYYCSENSVEGSYDDDFSIYSENDDCYYLPKGWYEHNECDEIIYFVTYNVTAWMPLPKAFSAIERKTMKSNNNNERICLNCLSYSLKLEKCLESYSMEAKNCLGFLNKEEHE